MTANGFRRMALRMEGAIEASHMGHPDFRAFGRIFATLDAEGKRGMVSLTPEQQKEFMAADPTMFMPASGAWGLQGATMVSLTDADEEMLGQAMTLAWHNAEIRSKKSSKSRRRVSKNGV